jgi:hypothetical protein
MEIVLRSIANYVTFYEEREIENFILAKAKVFDSHPFGSQSI